MTSQVADFFLVLFPRDGVTGVTGRTSTAAHSWQLNSKVNADSAFVYLHATRTQVKMTRESSLGFSSQTDALN